MSIAFLFFKSKIDLKSYVKQIGNTLWQNLQHLFFTVNLITNLGKKNQLESKQLRDSLKHGLVTARVGKMQTVKHSGTICSNAFTG